LLKSLTPSTPHTIPFARVSCDRAELDAVREVLESGWLTTAGKANLFEERFAQTVGSRYALAVNSCTAAMHLGLEALGIGPGDRVLVPTMTFTASAEIIRYLGADPVFLDVDYDTSLLTPEAVDRALAQLPKAKAVIVVHFGGQAAPMMTPDGRGILDVCRRRGVKVLEDAAHAFPARCGPRTVGSIGDVTCFSFYANKTITTGEGGMLTTDDEAVARRAKVMRLHGIDRDVWNRFTAGTPSWEYDVVAPGFKYNMPDINAAVGLAQLTKAAAMRDSRQRCAEYYSDRLAGLPGVDLPLASVPAEDHAWHLYPIVLTPVAKVERNRLIEMLARRGIGTSVHYKPLHRMTYYSERYHLNPDDFPAAERRWNGSVSLPIYSGLTDEETQWITDSLWDILG
jgi:dTDP-4-amino-4,6-dideoxygalactose transaminase